MLAQRLAEDIRADARAGRLRRVVLAREVWAREGVDFSAVLREAAESVVARGSPLQLIVPNEPWLGDVLRAMGPAITELRIEVPICGEDPMSNLEADVPELLPRLHTLEVRGHFESTPTGAIMAAARGSLRHLLLRHMHMSCFTDSAVQFGALVRALPQLETLELSPRSWVLCFYHVRYEREIVMPAEDMQHERREVPTLVPLPPTLRRIRMALMGDEPLPPVDQIPAGVTDVAFDMRSGPGENGQGQDAQRPSARLAAALFGRLGGLRVLRDETGRDFDLAENYLYRSSAAQERDVASGLKCLAAQREWPRLRISPCVRDWARQGEEGQAARGSRGRRRRADFVDPPRVPSPMVAALEGCKVERLELVLRSEVGVRAIADIMAAHPETHTLALDVAPLELGDYGGGPCFGTSSALDEIVRSTLRRVLRESFGLERLAVGGDELSYATRALWELCLECNAERRQSVRHRAAWEVVMAGWRRGPAAPSSPGLAALPWHFYSIAGRVRAYVGPLEVPQLAFDPFEESIW
jgi:hypothetical protein